MKKFTVALIVLFGMIIIPVWPANAGIIPIDLNDFFADPTVNVSDSGFSADFGENPFSSPALLSNDPFFDDPGISVPTDLLSLNFSYDFTLGSNNFDDFYAVVFDGNQGTVIDDFLIEMSGTGKIRWDLSGIDPSISLLGLEFQLNSWDALIDSTLNISGVFLETAAAPVPEPATVILFGTGLFGLLGLGRRKLRI